MTVPADHPDAFIVAAWNKRQEALAALEARGTFYDADDHSPKEMEAFDTLENGIPLLPALTAYGLIAKLWVSMTHRGPYCSTAEIRAEQDTIRRADYAEVEALLDRLDFDQQATFRAIRDLTHWLQFEPPQMKAAMLRAA
jgi:hypothetical protein